jgi:hypothetical protein
MDVLTTLDLAEWNVAVPQNLRNDAAAAIESGKVLYFPKLRFALNRDEDVLLSPTVLGGGDKNVSYDPANGKIKGAVVEGTTAPILRAMMRRYSDYATRLVREIFPAYAPTLETARTSYRPAEIAGRKYTPTKDDTRLHVDAFPTRPVHGRRIMRVFSNINPGDAPRVWKVGEPFPDMAKKMLPQVKRPMAIMPLLLAATGSTRGVRSRYDSLMLGLHDAAKFDETYQRTSPQKQVEFPAGTTWMCFTDQVMHAALSGQFVLEQTFHLDAEAMTIPESAPVRVLEKLEGRALV